MTPVFIRDTVAAGIEDLLKRRRELDLDLLDEVWEGVLRLSPPPHKVHQRFVGRLFRLFQAQAERYGLGEAYIQTGLREPGSGTSNYRVPDVMVTAPDREREQDGWLEGGVTLAVEVRSPREEVLEKLPFYAARGVDEVLYLDPRTFAFDLFRLAGKTYVAVSPDREGACEVRALALRVRRIEREGRALIEIEDARGGGPLPPL